MLNPKAAESLISLLAKQNDPEAAFWRERAFVYVMGKLFFSKMIFHNKNLTIFLFLFNYQNQMSTFSSQKLWKVKYQTLVIRLMAFQCSTNIGIAGVKLMGNQQQQHRVQHIMLLKTNRMNNWIGEGHNP